MKYCELCGKATKETITVNIEGTTLDVCETCAQRYNVKIKNTENNKSKIYIKDEDIEAKNNIEIVENFGEIIKKARNKLQITQEEAAKLLGISVIKYRQLEHEKIIPNEELIKKIEKAFKVRLLIKENNNQKENEEDIEIVMLN